LILLNLYVLFNEFLRLKKYQSELVLNNLCIELDQEHKIMFSIRKFNSLTKKKESNPILCNKLIFKNRVYILNHIFHNKSSCFVMMHSGGPENRSFLALQPIHTMWQKKIEIEFEFCFIFIVK
jgi:hypothetical protein